MAAPTAPTITPQALITLDPAANATRGVYARRFRPISAGYPLRAEGTDAALVGVNYPGNIVGGFPVGSVKTNIGGTQVDYSSPGTKLFRVSGKASTGLTTGIEWYSFGKTLTGGASVINPATGATAAGAVVDPDFINVTSTTVSLPHDVTVVDAATYANAILIAYPANTKDRSKAILFTRVEQGAALTASGQFGIAADSNSVQRLTVCWDFAGTTGVPAGYALELILTPAAEIIALHDVNTVAFIKQVTSCDFMFAGKTGQVGIVTLSRILQ